mgnify:CR=1 FL=1
MEALIGVLGILQLTVAIFLLIPVYYWIDTTVMGTRVFSDKDGKYGDLKVSIILPMRNEEKNVIRKLSTIIPELLSYENYELIVADSGSEDGTGELARNFLQSSELEFGKWRVEEFSIPGKNIAINGVIGKIDSDVVIISDADANVSPGWLDVVLQRLSEGDVGVVSGLEKVSKTSDFNSYYRTRSNRLRISESLIDSTPVLEGSLLA